MLPPVCSHNPFSSPSLSTLQPGWTTYWQFWEQVRISLQAFVNATFSSGDAFSPFQLLAWWALTYPSCLQNLGPSLLSQAWVRALSSGLPQLPGPPSSHHPSRCNLIARLAVCHLHQMARDHLVQLCDLEADWDSGTEQASNMFLNETNTTSHCNMTTCEWMCLPGSWDTDGTDLIRVEEAC